MFWVYLVFSFLPSSIEAQREKILVLEGWRGTKKFVSTQKSSSHIELF